jgi:hypothetical protein
MSTTVFTTKILAVALLSVSAMCSRAALTLQVGTVSVPAGSTNLVQLSVTVAGGDQFTDVVGFIQVGDGGPLMGGTAGPLITAVSFAGSVVSQPAGGFSSFSTINLPAMVYDPSVSLNNSGVYAVGNGLLMTLTLDVSGVSQGLYEVKFARSLGPDTAFQRAGQPVPVTIVNGSLAIGTTPIIRPKVSLRLDPALKAILTFPTETGRTYFIQWTTNLNSSPWIEATNVISGTGSTASWTDPSSGPSPDPRSRRFYRVRMGN